MQPAEILSKVKTSEGCSIWDGCSNPGGYGVVSINDRTYLVHRVVYALTKGSLEFESGMDVCHTCDNRMCIKPDHLFLGTRKDNMQDALSKGRLHRLFYEGEMWLIREIGRMFKAQHKLIKRIVTNLNYPARKEISCP
jgi:hypothetical protein